MLRIFLFICLNLLCVCVNGAKLRSITKFTKVECQANENFISEYKCIREGPDNSRLSIDLVVAHELTAFNFNMKLFVPRPPLPDFTKFYEVEVDTCKYMLDKKSNLIVDSSYAAMLKDSNQSPQCPISAGKLYYHNVSLSEHLPPYLPDIKFITQTLIILPNRTVIFNITTRGELLHRL